MTTSAVASAKASLILTLTPLTIPPCDHGRRTLAPMWSRLLRMRIGTYLVDLKPPARGTVCQSDRQPFDPELRAAVSDRTDFLTDARPGSPPRASVSCW